MKTDNIKIVKRSVNSKQLFDKINEGVIEAIKNFDTRWTNESYRKGFVDMLHVFLGEMTKEGLISQTKIIFDSRNNKNFSSSAKGYMIEVHYKQAHCLNKSKIEYHIKTK